MDDGQRAWLLSQYEQLCQERRVHLTTQYAILALFLGAAFSLTLTAVASVGHEGPKVLAMLLAVPAVILLRDVFAAKNVYHLREIGKLTQDIADELRMSMRDRAPTATGHWPAFDRIVAIEGWTFSMFSGMAIVGAAVGVWVGLEGEWMVLRMLVVSLVLATALLSRAASRWIWGAALAPLRANGSEGSGKP